jgi:uncharacterized membrane protein HdeD (DUF308 family)
MAMAMGMLQQISKSWGLIVLRGVVAILFGVAAFIWPGLTVAFLVALWGVYALFDGLLALVAAFRIRDGGQPMWPLLLLGLLGIAAGVVAFMRPDVVAAVFLGFIAAWAILTGILQIVAAVRFRKVIPNEWMLGLAGVLSIVFGALVIARPSSGALAVVWIIGAYAILLGLVLTMLGFRVKSLGSAIPKMA